MTRQHTLMAGLLATIAMLAGCSVYLSQTRIYQVDECQNLYMARVFATGQASEFFTNSSLFLLGPLSWIARRTASSVELFASARLWFVVIFWLNLLLLGAIASRRLFSLRGAIALAASATLAPLWDYGFEIRHDNLILTGILLIWWTMRVKPMGPISYFVAGAVSLCLLFIAVKTVVYVVPLAAALLVFPPPGHKQARWRLALAGGIGALAAILLIRICYGNSGGWEGYLSVFRGLVRTTGSVSRFWPWETLSRLFLQTPLLLAMAVAGSFAVFRDIWFRRFAALTWKSDLPEVLLLAGVLMALLMNPTPFAYNLLNVVPFLFLLAFGCAVDAWNRLQTQRTLWPVAGSIVVFIHLAPFGVATKRHLDWPNTRQQAVMRYAEELTDPVTDPVYDGAGLVASRRSIHFQWYLHSLNPDFINKPGSRVRDMLASQPAAVLITSYRTDWLPREDHDFIAQRYVPLSDDLWVLGTVLPPGGGSFEIVHAGRYRVDALPHSGILSTNGPAPPESVPAANDAGWIATLDGNPVSSAPVGLTLGTHRLEVPDHRTVAVVWLGPNLDHHPPFDRGNHRILFKNWY